jgi:high affinity Mn2+ porin
LEIEVIYRKKRLIFIFIIYNFTSILLYAAYAQPQDTSSQYNKNKNSQQLWNIHFQQTFVFQDHAYFFAKYSGNNSFINYHESAVSLTTTFFAGFRICDGLDFYLDPEVSGGAGLSHVQGIAGFPNNEVTRVGSVAPTFYLARGYLHETINFGVKTDTIMEEANQLREFVSPTRLNFVFGKYSLPDFFDDNDYSHDGRSQFMDWSLVLAGSWDYAADLRGYNIAFLTEFIKPEYSLRLALAMVVTDPNGAIFDRNIYQNHSFVFEFEKPYELFNKKGNTKLLLFMNSTHSANYREAINKNIYYYDSLSMIRRDGTKKYGISINFGQSICENIGLFLRAGWNDGKTETFMFTDIDKTLSFGTEVNGKIWNREQDKFGLALCFNDISPDFIEYLQKGGNSMIIGDGNLNHGIEQILETYYKFTLTDNISLSAFYQFINNPGYNKDRGPINVYSLRTHIEF